MSDTPSGTRRSSHVNITSLQSHILQGEAQAPGSTGDFTWILSAISLAAKAIAAKVRMARIEDVLGDDRAANESAPDEVIRAHDVLNEVGRVAVLDHIERVPVGRDGVEPELAGKRDRVPHRELWRIDDQE